VNIAEIYLLRTYLPSAFWDSPRALVLVTSSFQIPCDGAPGTFSLHMRAFRLDYMVISFISLTPTKFTIHIHSPTLCHNLLESKYDWQNNRSLWRLVDVEDSGKFGLTTRSRLIGRSGRGAKLVAPCKYIQVLSGWPLGQNHWMWVIDLLPNTETTASIKCNGCQCKHCLYVKSKPSLVLLRWIGTFRFSFKLLIIYLGYDWFRRAILQNWYDDIMLHAKVLNMRI